MLLKWKSDHLAAVISIMYAMHLAEPFELDQDVVITKITETSVAIMSWSYTGTLPGGLFSTRKVEKKNPSSFETVLDYSPLTNKIFLFGVFENKNVSYMESTDIVVMTVYDFEELFLGEYRLNVEQSSGGPAVSGPTIFYLCQEPEMANITAQISQTNISLTCDVESNSLGEEHRKNVTRIYYWKVNNETVDAGDNYEFNNNIEENSVNSSLVIKNIEMEMNGNNYICFAVEDGCGMASPFSSPYMLQAEDPNTLTSSLAPDDTSVSTDTPPFTEDLPTCQSCENGGTCNQTTLECICPDGFTGDTCELGGGAKCEWWCILLIVLVVLAILGIIIGLMYHYRVACFRSKSSAQIDVNQKQETNGYGMENKAY